MSTKRPCKRCGGSGEIGFNMSARQDPQWNERAVCPCCGGDGARECRACGSDAPTDQTQEPTA